MGLFSNLNTDGLEAKEDRVGGGGFTRESGVYAMTIKVAYAGASQGGAQFVDFTFVDDNEKEYRETFYVTGRNGQNWFEAKDKNGKPTGKKRALPGFDHVNDICLVTCDKTLSEMADEQKTVNVYDHEAGRQIPKSVPCLTELHGKKVYLAIQKRLENKNAKDSSGEYVATAETREVNTVEKVGHFPTKTTVVEAQESLEPAYLDTWAKNNDGKTLDKRTIKDGDSNGGTSGRPGGAPPTGNAGGAAPERKKLFG